MHRILKIWGASTAFASFLAFLLVGSNKGWADPLALRCALAALMSSAVFLAGLKLGWSREAEAGISTAPPALRAKHVLATLLLSLAAPGAGQAYNGRLGKAIAFAALALFWPLAILAARAGQASSLPLWMAQTGRLLHVAAFLAAFGDSVVEASRVDREGHSAQDSGWLPGLLFMGLFMAIHYCSYSEIKAPPVRASVHWQQM